jgi:hypothetical protein
MVSLSISIKGKPSITVDFPGKHPDKVTVKEVKAAVEAKFPKVGQLWATASLFASRFASILPGESYRTELILLLRCSSWPTARGSSFPGARASPWR